MGTGIGVGLLVDGQPVHGVLHPEAGHLRVRRTPGDRFPGVCAFHGDCLEGLASGPAIAARAGPPGGAALGDDPVWERVVAELGEGLASLLLVTAPRRIVLGGGVGLRPGLAARVAEAVDERLAGYLPEDRFGAPAQRVVPAALGADAGPQGALLLAELALSDA